MIDNPPPHKIHIHELYLDALSLQVRLGCTAEERATPQEVRISVEFRFVNQPGAFASDDLKQTICYAEVCAAIAEKIERQEFKLIEKLAADVYWVAREFARDVARVGVAVHKVRPPIAKLKGGTRYYCGDFSLQHQSETLPL